MKTKKKIILKWFFCMLALVLGIILLSISSYYFSQFEDFRVLKDDYHMYWIKFMLFCFIIYGGGFTVGSLLISCRWLSSIYNIWKDKKNAKEVTGK